MGKNIGTIISEKRKESGLTQEELATELHVTRQAVSNWERNVTTPDRPIVEKLANIIGANIDSYLRDTQKMKKKDCEKKMTTKIEEKELKKQKNEELALAYEPNKYDTAIGLFYAVSLFIGMAVAGLMIYFSNLSMGAISVGLIAGTLLFLILGLLSHAIITLVRKD